MITVIFINEPDKLGFESWFYTYNNCVTMVGPETFLRLCPQMEIENNISYLESWWWRLSELIYMQYQES